MLLQSVLLRAKSGSDPVRAVGCAHVSWMKTAGRCLGRCRRASACGVGMESERSRSGDGEDGGENLREVEGLRA
eukprot:2209706-Rhodomonas_salina.1